MFHVELRQFPHNFCRFNLSDAELRETILEPWVKGGPVELGDRRWDPVQTKLTVLEGPRLGPGELTMGRGWRAAERNGREVTDQLLSALRASGSAAMGSEAADRGSQADSLALDILADLANGEAPLYRAWELSLKRAGDHPGRALSLAEAAVESLVRSNLLAMLVAEGEKSALRKIESQDECKSILKAPVSWADRQQASTVWIART
jgi:hypothetical protein